MFGVAGDAGFGEASGEFLLGFVHGKDAFFGGHDKLGSVLEILAFFAFFNGKGLEFFAEREPAMVAFSALIRAQRTASAGEPPTEITPRIVATMVE